MKTQVQISDDVFSKLEKMAKLTLTSEEKSKIHSQLDEALKAVKVFDELELDNVEPLSHPGNLHNVMREDIVTPAFTQTEALQNAKAQHNGYFMVPGVLESQE